MAGAGTAGNIAMALLQIRGVSKTFRTLRALDGVDVTVEAGTFHGLIGPNGSGKSTLLKAIAGAHLPTGGTIHFGGHDITTSAPYQRAASDSVSNSRSPRCCGSCRSTTTFFWRCNPANPLGRWFGRAP